MSTTDLKSIVDAWQLVLAASPCSLVASQQAFSHDRQPNALVADSYWIEDAGQVSRSSMTNNREVRIDRLRIWVAKPMAFAGIAQFESMLELGDTLYRELVADGRTNGWNVEQQGHRVTHPTGTEIVVASFDFAVDYDWDGSQQS